MSIDKEIAEMMEEVANIQAHMRPVITEVYGRFLTESSDVEAREYSDPKDEIVSALIHRNYISMKDVEICRGFVLTLHVGQPLYDNMVELHNVLVASYPPE